MSDSLDPVDPSDMPDRSEAPAPLALAFRFLNRRERTVGEVRRHLLVREVGEEAIGETIAELTEQGYLDDSRYARMFVQDKRELEQWGNQRIRQGLLARGIDRDTAEAALAASDPSPTDAGSLDECDGGPGGELGRALALLRRRFPGPPRDRRERERALGVLLRKGYDPELAIDALAKYARESWRGERAA